MPHHFGIETHTRGRGRGGGGGCRYYYSSAGHTNRKKTKAREWAFQFHPPPSPIILSKPLLTMYVSLLSSWRKKESQCSWMFLLGRIFYFIYLASSPIFSKTFFITLSAVVGDRNTKTPTCGTL